MVKFSAVIQKFDKQGEKTGWTYIAISEKIAKKLMPNYKKSFRVKGKLDDFSIAKVALLPMGEGNYIIPLNATIRKELGKQNGATVEVQLQLDTTKILPPAALLQCMEDEPEAIKYFYTLPQSHRNYFTKWIDNAKTDATKAKRIALVIKAMLYKMDFGAMLRLDREERKVLLG